MTITRFSEVQSLEDVHLALSRLNSNQDLTSKGIGYGSKNVGYLVLGGKIEAFKQICQMMGISKKRFKIEAKAAAALNHPNIATIHQIEEETFSRKYPPDRIYPPHDVLYESIRRSKKGDNCC